MNTSKLKRIAGILPAIALCTMMHLSAQASDTCGVNNLWVNGTFENLTVGNQCNIFNPVNAYSSAAPFYGYTTFTWEAGMFLQPTFVDEATIDHTTGAAGGHYLYVDPRAATGATSQVKQSIKVVAGTTYNFQAWFCSMLMPAFSSAPAVVELYVGGVSVSTTLTLNSLSANIWIPLSGTWIASTTGYVDVEIKDWDPVVGGHDFAIDDITFGKGILVANAGDDFTICPNAPFTLGGSPTADFGATCSGSYSYLWTPAAGLTTSNTIANPSGSIPTPGVYTYTVRVTDLEGNTCKDNVKVTVKKCDDPHRCTADNLWVNPTWENLTIDNHCNIFNPINAYSSSAPFYGYTTFTWEAGMFLQPTFVDEATVDHTLGTSGGHYLYVDPRANTGATSQVKQSIKVEASTTYTFSAWFCSMLMPAFSANPAVVELYVNGASVSTTLTLNSLSPNGWIQLSGTWTSPSVAGYVDVEIKDWDPVVGGHDFAIDDVYFGAGSITAHAGADATICSGSSYHLGGAPTADFGATCFGEYAYNWTPTTGFTTPSNVANPTIVLSSPGVYTYSVTVTDLNGYTCTDDVTITVRDCSTRPGSPDIQTATGTKVYPNPTDGRVVFEGLPATASNIIIYSINGQILSNNVVDANTVTLDISSLPNGMYYYVVTDKAGSVLERNKVAKQ